MSPLKQALVIARRDFTAIVLTPTFLLFLLAPLFMAGFSLVGGLSAKMVADSSDSRERMIAYVPAAEVAAFTGADKRLRALAGTRRPLLPIEIHDASAMPKSASAMMRSDADILGILSGSAARPTIHARNADGYTVRHLSEMAEIVAREGPAAASDAPVSRATLSIIAATTPAKSTRSALGYGAVFLIFILTIMLAGQAVGMLAEEKGNKVIEILAAAAPLESVFLGKLLGMLGVALLFVSFWGALVAGVVTTTISQLPGAVTQLTTLQPAIGWPLFLLFGLAYFLAAFLLLGAVFLGIGAMASSVREIQMLSLPITIFQIAMFSLASAAANMPDSTVALIGQALPWSSPMAMAARGATDPSLWPHLLALVWQAVWVAITIRVSVRAFRASVLRTGGPSLTLFRRKGVHEAQPAA